MSWKYISIYVYTFIFHSRHAYVHIGIYTRFCVQLHFSPILALILSIIRKLCTVQNYPWKIFRIIFGFITGYGV